MLIGIQNPKKKGCPPAHPSRTEYDPECIRTPTHLLISLSDRESANGDIFLLTKGSGAAGVVPEPELSDTVVTDNTVPTKNVTKPIELLPKSWQKMSNASCWYAYTLTQDCRWPPKSRGGSYTDTEQRCYTVYSVILRLILKRVITRVNLPQARPSCGQWIIQSMAEVIEISYVRFTNTYIPSQTESNTCLYISPCGTKLGVSNIYLSITLC
jgi:hypothetical protein